MRSDRSGDFTCWRDRQNQATCLWVIRQTLDSVGKEAQSKSDQVYQPPYLCPQQVAAGDWVLVEDSQTAWALPAASVPAITITAFSPLLLGPGQITQRQV